MNVNIKKLMNLDELVIEYQKFEDPEIFRIILGRVDKLICKTVHTIRRREKHLRLIPFEDLYQTGILGLRAAVLTAKMQGPGEKILLRIKAYVKSNIRKVYRYSGREYAIDTAWIYEKEDESEDVDLVDLVNLREILKELYLKEIISDKDLELINYRFVKGYTYIKISKIYNIGAPAVWFRMSQLLIKIRSKYEREMKEMK